MKRIFGIVFFITTAGFAIAGHERPDDLVVALEKAVLVAAKGDPGAAARALNAEARTSKQLSEVNAQAENFRSVYQKIGALGEFDDVERLSLRFTGESFFRLRVVDKRAEGVVLWTFIGYKFKGQWYCKSVDFNGSDDLATLMKQNLDAADAR